MSVQLLTEQHLEFLSIKGYTRSCQPTPLLEITCRSSNLDKVLKEVRIVFLSRDNCFQTFSIKIRGHNVFWGVDKNVQPWVQALSKQDLLTEMDKRIKGVIGHTKGL